MQGTIWAKASHNYRLKVILRFNPSAGCHLRQNHRGK